MKLIINFQVYCYISLIKVCKMGGGQFFLATTNSKHIGIEKSKDQDQEWTWSNKK